MFDLTVLSFFALGVCALVLSGFLITRRSPVAAAVLLITTFIVLAGMYGLLEAHFAAATQIVVYAGAIMVVFVFVIMLLNLPLGELRYGRMTFAEYCICGVGICAAILFGTRLGQSFAARGLSSVILPGSNVPYYSDDSTNNLKNIAALMFTDYLWAFEMISFLILAAIVGAVVIAKKKERHVKPT